MNRPDERFRRRKQLDQGIVFFREHRHMNSLCSPDFAFACRALRQSGCHGSFGVACRRAYENQITRRRGSTFPRITVRSELGGCPACEHDF